MEGLGVMEKVTFEDSKERLVQMDSFWFAKNGYIFSSCKANR